MKVIKLFPTTKTKADTGSDGTEELSSKPFKLPLEYAIMK